MSTTHWIVVAAVVIGSGAGSLAAQKGRPERPTPVRTERVATATERAQVDAIEDAMTVEYQPPPRAAAEQPRARWVAPELSVVGRLPAGEPGVRAQPPRPEDAVRLALRHKRARFEHCFEMELRKQAVFSGFVVLSLSVSTTGQVTQTRVMEGDRREAAVGACIAGQLRTLKLPEVAYEAELILPIRLQAEVPVS